MKVALWNQTVSAAEHDDQRRRLTHSISVDLAPRSSSHGDLDQRGDDDDHGGQQHRRLVERRRRRRTR